MPGSAFLLRLVQYALGIGAACLVILGLATLVNYLVRWTVNGLGWNLAGFLRWLRAKFFG